MNLQSYFVEKRGLGVMSTSNASGDVNSALYATPHFLEDGLLSFIMRDRLTHANLQSNTKANFMFIEKGGVKGVRLNLLKVSESEDQEKIGSLSRRNPGAKDVGEKRYLVSFKVVNTLALLGGEELEFE